MFQSCQTTGTKNKRVNFKDNSIQEPGNGGKTSFRVEELIKKPLTYKSYVKKTHSKIGESLTRPAHEQFHFPQLRNLLQKRLRREESNFQFELNEIALFSFKRKLNKVKKWSLDLIIELCKLGGSDFEEDEKEGPVIRLRLGRVQSHRFGCFFTEESRKRGLPVREDVLFAVAHSKPEFHVPRSLDALRIGAHQVAPGSPENPLGPVQGGLGRTDSPK